MRRAEAIGLIIGSVIGAFFGRVWLSWAGTGLPQAQRALDVIGWTILAGIVVWAVAIGLTSGKHARTQAGSAGRAAMQAAAAGLAGTQASAAAMQAGAAGPAETQAGSAAAVEEQRRQTRLWGTVVTVEVALIIVGQQVLMRVLDRPEWAPVWTLLVVGVHFFPLSRFYPPFRLLGAALVATAAVTVVVAEVTGDAAAWYTFPGFGGAAFLWMTAMAGLASATRGKSVA